MDPITAAALSTTLMPLVSGAAGEAGKKAWESLAAFVGKRFGRRSDAAKAARSLAQHPDDAEHGELLAGILERAAAQDGDVADWIREWLRDAAPLADPRGAQVTTVTNVVSGNARVHGPVIQSHTISGPITFGASATPPSTPDSPQ